RAQATTAAPAQASEKAKGKQPETNVEDPPEIDPSTLASEASKTRATRTTPRRTTAAVEVDEAVMAPTTTVTIPGRDHLHLRNLLLDHRRLDPLRSSLALMDPSVTTGLQDMGPQDTKVLKATVHVLDFVAVEAFIEAVEDRTIIMGLTHAPHHVVDPSPAVGRAQHPASIWAIFL
ncbi:hypothetical protein PHISP_08484, partial [Aspergillus sp. HF37]